MQPEQLQRLKIILTDHHTKKEEVDVAYNYRRAGNALQFRRPGKWTEAPLVHLDTSKPPLVLVTYPQAQHHEVVEFDFPMPDFEYADFAILAQPIPAGRRRVLEQDEINPPVQRNELDLLFADLPAHQHPVGSIAQVTFRRVADGVLYSVQGTWTNSGIRTNDGRDINFPLDDRYELVHTNSKPKPPTLDSEEIDYFNLASSFPFMVSPVGREIFATAFAARCGIPLDKRSSRAALLLNSLLSWARACGAQTFEALDTEVRKDGEMRMSDLRFHIESVRTGIPEFRIRQQVHGISKPVDVVSQALAKLQPRGGFTGGPSARASRTTGPPSNDIEKQEARFQPRKCRYCGILWHGSFKNHQCQRYKQQNDPPT